MLALLCSARVCFGEVEVDGVDLREGVVREIEIGAFGVEGSREEPGSGPDFFGGDVDNGFGFAEVWWLW